MNRRQTERWVTKDQVIGVCERYEASIPGWRCPLLFGVGLQGVDEETWFPFACHGDHPLPAVILASVLGHDGGTESYTLTLDQLDEAIDRLAPAEACLDFEHPNLAAWREVREAALQTSGQTIVAVFDANPESRTADSNVLALRRQG
jgi:hypothetical protein